MCVCVCVCLCLCVFVCASVKILKVGVVEKVFLVSSSKQLMAPDPVMDRGQV